MTENKHSSAQEFVESLLNEGANIYCDETCESFNDQDILPPFYDEEMYKKGQQFFYKHMFALFFGKCLGLISVLSVPSILNILIFTNQSSTELTSYRRYLATVFHMMVWYDSDFKPGSRLWKSIAEVRNRHNSASQRSCSAKLNRITQKDMALTQFGFMGYALIRNRMVGVYRATEEEWKAFIHIWRVIGYLMGIENRFNICSGTVEETKQICNIVVEKVFRPSIEKKDKDFLKMSRYMLNGLWCMNPNLNFESYMCYLHIVTQKISDKETIPPTYIKMNFRQRLSFNLMVFNSYYLRRTWYRLYQNFIMTASLWLMKHCPFLAYYRFGIGNSHVHIIHDNKND